MDIKIGKYSYFNLVKTEDIPTFASVKRTDNVRPRKNKANIRKI